MRLFFPKQSAGVKDTNPLIFQYLFMPNSHDPRKGSHYLNGLRPFTLDEISQRSKTVKRTQEPAQQQQPSDEDEDEEEKEKLSKKKKRKRVKKHKHKSKRRKIRSDSSDDDASENAVNESDMNESDADKSDKGDSKSAIDNKRDDIHNAVECSDKSANNNKRGDKHNTVECSDKSDSVGKSANTGSDDVDVKPSTPVMACTPSPPPVGIITPSVIDESALKKLSLKSEVAEEDERHIYSRRSI